MIRSKLKEQAPR